VTRWRPGDTSGFLTDRAGRSWFISRDDLPEGLDQLPVETVVSFQSSPSPAPGKRYPRAYSLQIVGNATKT
jgi:hypothetical protein